LAVFESFSFSYLSPDLFKVDSCKLVLHAAYSELAALITTPQLPAQAAKCLLLANRQVAELIHYSFEVQWENALNQLPPTRSEANQDLSTVVLLTLTAYPAVTLEIVDHQGHVPGSSQQFLAELFLAHGTQVKKGFHRAKLPQREAHCLQIGAQLIENSFGSADQINVSIQGCRICLVSLVVRRHCCSPGCCQLET
jgi:hypothetical protein